MGESSTTRHVYSELMDRSPGRLHRRGSALRRVVRLSKHLLHLLAHLARFASLAAYTALALGASLVRARSFFPHACRLVELAKDVQPGEASLLIREEHRARQRG